IRHKEWKAAHESVDGGPVPEIDPVTFWAELVGPELPGDPDAVAAWLHAEAHRLMYDYSRVKSARTLRPGIVELLRTAGDLGSAERPHRRRRRPAPGLVRRRQTAPRRSRRPSRRRRHRRDRARRCHRRR